MRDVSLRQPYGRRYGDLEAVEDFIAVGKDVNESDEEDRTPLHYAVAYNHAEIVDELIANGANLEAQVQLFCQNASASNGCFPQICSRQYWSLQDDPSN